VLSKVFLKNKFRRMQILGVLCCIVGLVILVLSDYFYNPRPDANNPILGDILCLMGSVLYAISNVGQEGLLRKYSRFEWLSFIGIGGSVVSGIQLIILERHELSQLSLDLPFVPVLLLIVAYALCLFMMYSLTPFMMMLGSATLFNLSLLTSDVFAILIGVYLFDSTPSSLYFLSFVIILGGLILYKIENREEFSKLEQYEKVEEET